MLGQGKYVLKHVVAPIQITLDVMGQPGKQNVQTIQGFIRGLLKAEDLAEHIHVVPPETVCAELFLTQGAFLDTLQ